MLVACFLCFLDGVFKLQAYLLRGTMYTLMSKVDDAMADLDCVINAGDDDKYTKVGSNLKTAQFTI